MTKKKESQKPYHFKVSNLGPHRKHIEIPSKNRDAFESGEVVEILKLKRAKKVRRV
jgi:hypothetical protein